VPPTLPSSGGTATIRATVLDDIGNAVPGVPVTFSTDQGTLSTASAVTDALGVATSTLTTSATAKVTAHVVGSGTGAVAADVTVTVLAPGVLVVTVPTTLTASAPATFTVRPTAASATDVVLDYGDGEKTSFGAVAKDATVSATHLYATGGRTYDVIASATFADGATTQVKNTVFVADWDVVPSCGGNVTFGSSSTLSATVSPAGAGAPQIQSYVWSIFDGDGSTTRQGQTVTYIWQSRGTKTVRLTATPAKGAATERVCSLEVQ
jgi:hypothetical protein